MYSKNGTNMAHSGQGRFVGNFIATLVFLAMFCAAIFALSFWTLENAWIPGLSCFVLFVAAFAIPQHILGMSDRAPGKAASER